SISAGLFLPFQSAGRGFIFSYGSSRINSMREIMSPRNLRVFLAVYEERSGARAAERLLRAPSAITRVIQELESHLDLRLFDRLPSGMSPTPTGHLVYQRAK